MDETRLDPSGTSLVASGRTETTRRTAGGYGDLVPGDLLVIDATDLHELMRIPRRTAPDGARRRTPGGFSAEDTRAYVLTYRPSGGSRPSVQLLDPATGTLVDCHFDAETMELLPLRP